jgi:hypothetical protein
MNFFKLSIIGILIFALAFSCSSINERKDNLADTVADSLEDGRVKHASIDFDEDFFDLGTLKQGEVISHTFSFKNNGNIPLVIHDVIVDCGCTDTKTSKDIVKPTEEATLEVIFDSRGWYGSQFKSVTIVSNAITPRRSVTIKANINP